MTWVGMNVFALIPARGGSVGVPRKNLVEVGGHSLIARAAKVALSLDWLDLAILSTDDEEMAIEGCRSGLSVPFMRPQHLAEDSSLAVDVWRHAWLHLEEATGEKFDLSVLLEPSCPLRLPEDVQRCVATLFEGSHASAATISATPGRFNAFKAVIPDGRGVLHPAFKGSSHEPRRQHTPDHYHRNGACYAVRRSTLVDDGRIAEIDCVGVPVARPIVNIDEPIDVDLARLLEPRSPLSSHAIRPWPIKVSDVPGLSGRAIGE